MKIRSYYILTSILTLLFHSTGGKKKKFVTRLFVQPFG